MPETRADNVLMQKVRDGDLAKMAVLFERHHRALFRYFLRLTGNREFSEDLVQDVYFRMLKYRHTYRDSNPFTSWMYQVGRNAHLDGLQKRKGEGAGAEPVSKSQVRADRGHPGVRRGRRQGAGLSRHQGAQSDLF
jgi:RNA polymerase sigma-70 factor (ECF subfamily)